MLNYKVQAESIALMLDRKLAKRFDFSEQILMDTPDEKLVDDMREALDDRSLWKQTRKMIVGAGEMIDKLDDMQKQIDEMYRDWKRSN